MDSTFKIGQYEYQLPSRDHKQDGVATLALMTANDAANSFATAKNAIMNDQHLTSVGKLSKLKPLSDGLWSQIFASTENIQHEANRFTNREAKLYAVPQISTPYEIAIDRERRDWFRTLSRPEIVKIAGEVKAGDEHKDLIAAILRSPIPLGLDDMARIVQEAHEENCRAAFPDEWEQIKEGLEAVAWAQRGMGFVIGITNGLTERKGEAVLIQALSTGHEYAAIVLFGADEVTQAKQRIKHQSQAAA